MTEICFTLQETPDGRWHLKRGTVSHGFYESPAKGEEAIHRILHPTILNYNSFGELIK